MLLKRLELHGFKSFADTTTFEFDRGITAIIGPNGSGKSNVSDAIRWVLGEQSMRNLRGKRTEDVIFAGSSQRSSLGMAEVSLTFDNSDQSIDLPFSEVVFTRRAYRSGENEYLINRERVRYRDMMELLQKANITGNSYTVIGQGLVDEALSLKADERRALLEEAADIKRYRAKLASSREKLLIAQQNVLRANDLVNEIKPRLLQLENQAHVLQQHQDIINELSVLQRQWFGHQWNRCVAHFKDSENDIRRIKVDIAESEMKRERFSDQLLTISAEGQELATAIQNHRTEREAISKLQTETQRALAVLTERHASAARQLQDQEGEWAGLEAERQQEIQRVAELRQRLEEFSAQENTATEFLRQREAELSSRREERRRLATTADMSQQRVFEAATRKADINNKIISLRDRAKEAEKERAKHQRSVDDGRQKLLNHQQQHNEAQSRLERFLAETTDLERQRDEFRRRGEEQRTKQQELLAKQAETKGQLGQLRTRIDLLSKLQSSRTGYYSGVKAVLDGAGNGSGKLQGIVGVVASVIRASAELETAIEMALGSQAQDIVVSHWVEAEAAVEFLKRTNAGRATFLPLDTLKYTVRRSPTGAETLPQNAWPPIPGNGILGVAAELVHYEPHLEAVAWYTLGRTIIVDALTTARRVLRTCPPGWVIVTLAGELVRPGGAITGGSRDRQGTIGLLARERELRDLPAAIAKVEASQAMLSESLTALRQEEITLSRQREDLEQHLTRSARQLEEAKRLLASSERDSDRLERELAWGQSTLDRLDKESRSYTDRAEQLNAELVIAEESLKARSQDVAEAKRCLADSEVVEREAATAVSDAARELAIRHGEIKSCRELLETRLTSVAGLDKQLALKRHRQSELNELLATGQGQAARMEEELRGYATSIQAIDEAIQEVTACLNQIHNRQEEVRQLQSRLGQQATEYEARLREAIAETARWRQELDRLRQQAENEDGLELPPSFLRQLTMPLEAGMAAEMPLSATGDPEEIKRRIDELKARRRTVGMVNPQAITEYEEARNRHDFLLEQVTDLEKASTALQKVISELEKTARSRFDETFTAVAKQFSQNFQTLFGGGNARLTLSNDGDVAAPGIDIIAQPPGKRAQNLALLSGGERALTAAALVFAVLQVISTPFAVLDEVDAALDDSNVMRFSNLLADLGKKTQFIIITHNRSTMDGADTLYGISMGEAHTSRAISLRMPSSIWEKQEADVEVG